MTRGLNKVMVIGHLGRDPEMRFTSGGRPVAAFSVATARGRTDSDGERQEEIGRQMGDDETLRKMWRVMGRGAELERYKAFSRASRQEKIRTLDAEIARQEAQRAERQERPRQSDAQRQTRAGEQRGTQSATQVVRRMVQQDNPQTGVFGLGAEYRRALKERRKQLGLPER